MISLYSISMAGKSPVDMLETPLKVVRAKGQNQRPMAEENSKK